MTVRVVPARAIIECDHCPARRERRYTSPDTAVRAAVSAGWQVHHSGHAHCLGCHDRCPVK